MVTRDPLNMNRISLLCIIYSCTMSVNSLNSYVFASGSRGSSGSTVSYYGLEDRAIEVRSPTGAEDFSCSPFVQNGSGAHPASYPVGTGGFSPRGKARPGRDADHSPLSSVEVENE
jgi:hypothetical protein